MCYLFGFVLAVHFLVSVSWMLFYITLLADILKYWLLLLAWELDSVVWTYCLFSASLVNSQYYFGKCHLDSVTNVTLLVCLTV